VDAILDKAGSKGTGKWTSQDAMDLPVSIPAIDMAVSMRDLSVYKDQRLKASQLYKPEITPIDISNEFLTELENALGFCFAIAYAQGLSMLAQASEIHQMNIPLPDVIKTWKGGCIIRSAFLGNFSSAFEKNSSLANLLLDKEISEMLMNREESVRNVLAAGIHSRIPMACMSSALAYYDAYISERLPMNLIQAQRDFFGAHTYQRTDKEGVFHTEWNSD
jgi:6-phosphogluconate dehydrogenase